MGLFLENDFFHQVVCRISVNINTVSFRTSDKYFLHVYRKHIKHYKWQPAFHLIQQLERGLGNWVTQPSSDIMAEKCHICNVFSIIMLTITHMHNIFVHIYTFMYFYKYIYLCTFTDIRTLSFMQSECLNTDGINPVIIFCI